MSSLASGPRMMSSRSKSNAIQQHLTFVAFIVVLSIALLNGNGNGIGFVSAAKEVATNTFYVKITPDAANSHENPNEVAHKIARRNGFHNLGPVRKYSNQLNCCWKSISCFGSCYNYVTFLYRYWDQSTSIISSTMLYHMQEQRDRFGMYDFWRQTHM